jgi:predicted NAD/FAD-binding protein
MKNIAIIGSGISGLTSAYLLAKKHKVTVFEKNEYIGGHTATVDVEVSGKSYAIDTGFIVFNNKTYPNYLALLDEIGVGKQEAEMSFSVHNTKTKLEYNGHNLNTLFVQRRNIFRPKFWGLVSEILRFNKLCKQAFESERYNEEDTLGDFLTEYNFSAFFAEHYILPMGAAIWSSSLTQMEGFQFQFFVRFFHHHGLLNIVDRPQWYVIPNGSRSYLTPLCKTFSDNIRVNSNIKYITRNNDKVQLHFADLNNDTGDLHSDKEHIEEFDEVVIACHSDQALALLEDPSSEETAILNDMPYSENSVVLHTDINLLPKRKKAWASWNYQLSADRDKPASVTYNMNILQGLNSAHTFCVTLNQRESIAPEKILREFTYHHPIFSLKSIAAQKMRKNICGQRHTHYAGAYWHSGFHEDGVRSGVEVAQRFNCYLGKQETNCSTNQSSQDT